MLIFRVLRFGNIESCLFKYYNYFQSPSTLQTHKARLHPAEIGRNDSLLRTVAMIYEIADI